MMATLRNRHPANVVPIALSIGRFLKLFERMGRVPKTVTIRKKISITATFRMMSTSSL